jgi:hypothetical protein
VASSQEHPSAVVSVANARSRCVALERLPVFFAVDCQSHNLRGSQTGKQAEEKTDHQSHDQKFASHFGFSGFDFVACPASTCRTLNDLSGWSVNQT